MNFLKKDVFSCENGWEFIKISTPLISAQAAIAIPWILAFAMIGYTKDIISMTALGLSMTYYNLFAYALVVSIIEVVGANCSKAFGAQHYRAMAGYFYKSLILITIVGVLYYLSIFAAGDVLLWVNIEPEVVVRTVSLIKISWYFGFI